MKYKLLTKIPVLFVVIAGLLGCATGASSAQTAEAPKAPEPAGLAPSTVIFTETFDKVPDNTSIRPKTSDGRTDSLDNPDKFFFANISGDIYAGTPVSGKGAIALATNPPKNSERMAFVVPGLATLKNPVLRLTIKNDNGAGGTVAGLMLNVGDSYSTTGTVGIPGHRAHGSFAITSGTYQVFVIPLNKKFTLTETIQLRPVVGTSSSNAAGICIDKIEVLEK